MDSIKQLEQAINDLKEHYLFKMNSSLSKTIFFSLIRGLSFGLGSVIGATTELEYTHTGLANGTEYCYYVTVTYTGDNTISEPSATVCATPSIP